MIRSDRRTERTRIPLRVGVAAACLALLVPTGAGGGGGGGGTLGSATLPDNGVSLPTGMAVTPRRATDSLEARSTDSDWTHPDGTRVAGMPAHTVLGKSDTAAIEMAHLSANIRLDLTYHRQRLGKGRGGASPIPHYPFGGETADGTEWMLSLFDAGVGSLDGRLIFTLPNGSQVTVDPDEGIVRTPSPYYQAIPDLRADHVVGAGREHWILSQKSTGTSYYYGRYDEVPIIGGVIQAAEVFHISRVDHRGQDVPFDPAQPDANVLERVDIDWQAGYMAASVEAPPIEGAHADAAAAEGVGSNFWLGGNTRERNLPTGIQVYEYSTATQTLEPTRFVYATFNLQFGCAVAYYCFASPNHVRLYEAPPAYLLGGRPVPEFYPPGPFDPLAEGGPYEPVQRIREYDPIGTCVATAGGSVCTVTAWLHSRTVVMSPGSSNVAWRWSNYFPGYDPPPVYYQPSPADPDFAWLFEPAGCGLPPHLEGLCADTSQPVIVHSGGDPGLCCDPVPPSFEAGLFIRETYPFDQADAWRNARGEAFAILIKDAVPVGDFGATHGGRPLRVARAKGGPPGVLGTYPAGNAAGVHDWRIELDAFDVYVDRVELPRDDAGIRPRIDFTDPTPLVRYRYTDVLDGAGGRYDLWQRVAFWNGTDFGYPDDPGLSPGRITVEEWSQPQGAGTVPTDADGFPSAPSEEIRVVDLLFDNATAYPLIRWRWLDRPLAPGNEIQPAYTKDGASLPPDGYQRNGAVLDPVQAPDFAGRCDLLANRCAEDPSDVPGFATNPDTCCLDVTRFESVDATAIGAEEYALPCELDSASCP